MADIEGQENEKFNPSGQSTPGNAVASALRNSVILAVTGLLLYAAIWPFAANHEPGIGPRMLLLAVGLCVGVGIKMILIEHAFFGNLTGMLTMTMGMIFRMGIPLMVLGIVTIQFGKEIGQSLARYLLVVYPITLLLETLLTVFHFNAEDDLSGKRSRTDSKTRPDEFLSILATNFE